MALPRKHRRQITPGWSHGLDLHDYAGIALQRRRARSADSGPIVVTDDWPAQVPIGEVELRVIEGHLRKELDELFGPLP